MPTDIARSSAVACTTCGVFALTFAAQFTLHTICLLRRITSAELFHQPRKLQQIRRAEKRPMLAADDLRVGSDQIGPLRRNRTDGRIIDAQQESPSREVVPLAHAKELRAAEWVKRVCDSDKTPRCDWNTRILD